MWHTKLKETTDVPQASTKTNTRCSINYMDASLWCHPTPSVRPACSFDATDLAISTTYRNNVSPGWNQTISPTMFMFCLCKHSQIWYTVYFQLQTRCFILKLWHTNKHNNLCNETMSSRRLYLFHPMLFSDVYTPRLKNNRVFLDSSKYTFSRITKILFAKLLVVIVTITIIKNPNMWPTIFLITPIWSVIV